MKKIILALLFALAGWSQASAANITAIPFYWLNSASGNFFTTSATEVQQCVASGYWKNYGPKCYINSISTTGTVPFYRLTSPWGHLYTTSWTEVTNCAAQGWTYECVAGYVYSSWVTNTVPFYRLSHPTLGHYYTTSWPEVQQDCANGWHYESVAGYVFSAAAIQEQPAPQPVFAMYDSQTGDHIYTATTSERQRDVEFGLTDLYASSFYTSITQSPGTVPFYRLLSPDGLWHFYTTSATELQNCLNAGWINQPNIGYVYTTQVTGTVPLYRLNSSWGHYYTTSWSEAQWDVSHGWVYEGVACYVLTGAAVQPQPVPFYRLNYYGKHFYTASLPERVSANTAGWSDELNVGYIFPIQAAGTIPFYRLNNATAGHLYTTSAVENQNLVNQGWTSEGLAGYVYATQVAGSIPLYRLTSSFAGHFYTTSAAEVSFCQQNGWVSEGVACYLPNGPTCSDIDMGGFVAGTKVLTNKGYVTIEQIKLGDMVASTNMDGTYQYQTVLRTYQSNRVGSIRLTLADGSQFTTSSEQFLNCYNPDLNADYWTAAGILFAGVQIECAMGKRVTISRVEQLGTPMTFYSMEVANTHQYIIGQEGIFVHNDSFMGKVATKLAEKTLGISFGLPGLVAQAIISTLASTPANPNEQQALQKALQDMKIAQQEITINQYKLLADSLAQQNPDLKATPGTAPNPAPPQLNPAPPTSPSPQVAPPAAPSQSFNPSTAFHSGSDSGAFSGNPKDPVDRMAHDDPPDGW